GCNSPQSLLSASFTSLGNIPGLRLGISLTFFPDAVTHEVGQALPWTIGLIGVTTILAFVLGTFIGLLAAWRRGGELGGLLPPIVIITSPFPYFLFALLAILLFSMQLRWPPPT